MTKLNYATMQKFGGIFERAMSALIDERISKFGSKSLRESKVRRVAVRKQRSRRLPEEPRQCPFQGSEQRVITGRAARCCDVQSKLFQSRAQGFEHARMTRHSKIIAATEVNQLATTMKDKRAVDLLKRCGELHLTTRHGCAAEQCVRGSSLQVADF